MKNCKDNVSFNAKSLCKSGNFFFSVQAAELAAVKLNTENQVVALKREGEVKRLAFSVSLLASDYRTIGPFNTDITLIFKRVVTNIGNAYNPDTGLFTAPVRGVYHFEFHIYGHGSPNPTSAVLIKNGEQICTSYTSQPAGAQKASNGVSLLLEIGNVVYLRMWANSWVHDNQNRHTTFSGHLLFTM
uniref:C1q domain-containing protein n=1 Tax=Xiphophorus maculatus TaxID=8083 RepID=A0A3B5QZR8_XIPMA